MEIYIVVLHLLVNIHRVFILISICGFCCQSKMSYECFVCYQVEISYSFDGPEEGFCNSDLCCLFCLFVVCLFCLVINILNIIQVKVVIDLWLGDQMAENKIMHVCYLFELGGISLFIFWCAITWILTNMELCVTLVNEQLIEFICSI